MFAASLLRTRADCKKDIQLVDDKYYLENYKIKTKYISNRNNFPKSIE